MPKSLVETFAQRWQCVASMMAGDPNSHLSYMIIAPGTLMPSHYDGGIDGIILQFNGRWGNYVFQMINLFHAAEVTGAKKIYLHPTDVFPLKDDVEIAGLQISSIHRKPAQDANVCLQGVFFDPRPLGKLLDSLTPNRRVELARKYILPLMDGIAPPDDLITPGSILLHIRSGDIFEGPEGQGGRQTGGNLYIQPPLCFFQQVVSRASNGIKAKVYIISENALNPVILPLVRRLDSAGHAVTLRLNQSLNTDLSWLLAGSHVAFANGTIGIAVALLSVSLRNAYFFRHDGTGTAQPVETYLGDQIVKHFANDVQGGYIPIGGWRNTAEQRRLMCDFDGSNLAWESDTRAAKGLQNVALGKHASQSSTSIFSKPNESADGVNGVKTGSFAFCTEREPSPWWQVDLGADVSVEEIRVYNRMDVPYRAYSMKIYARDSEGNWRLVHDQGGRRFGGVDGYPAQVWLGGQPMNAVRVQLPDVEYLHLDEIEVMAYGAA